MNRVQADFAVRTGNGIVTNVGRSTISVPKTNFGGGHIKWYEDKREKYFSKSHQHMQRKAIKWNR